ncbi:ATP-binding protein [Rhodococcus sp. SORGH_AS_0303]|uniref:ATP-binding protein n=1 Tax=Rhodococcus sp. SORGH_AS_0303 TaxID=3041753 RepID=UPI0027862020|nr:ATP-binding protein [Rhodococcus sp. SORGH_AS_0303]MDQ1203151.1 serine/threonine-protein kinase RsbW [Rhodococcus sp. SORGH_AS_0303]
MLDATHGGTADGTVRPSARNPDFVVSGVPADALCIGAVRRALAAWLHILPFDDACRADVVLAVYEAMANVVDHAYLDTDGVGTMQISVTFSMDDGTLDVTVADLGQWKLPVHNALRGNGLRLVAALSTSSTVDHSGTGTTVRATWSSMARQHPESAFH